MYTHPEDSLEKLVQQRIKMIFVSVADQAI